MGSLAVSRKVVPRAYALYPNLYPALQDTNNHMIRYVFPNGTINRIAGNGTASYFGDGGPGRSATLSSPNSVWPDGAGGVFIAEVRPA